MAGRERAVLPSRMSARAWVAIFAATDGEPPRGVSWMPAHTSEAEVGRHRCILVCVATTWHRATRMRSAGCEVEL